MIALYKQKQDNIQLNRLSFLQSCEGMIALYKQRKDNIQGILYTIYNKIRSEIIMRCTLIMQVAWIALLIRT